MKTDVLIVGSGSAGVCSAAWLAKCHIPCIIIDKRDGPLVMGQADGVQVGLFSALSYLFINWFCLLSFTSRYALLKFMNHLELPKKFFVKAIIFARLLFGWLIQMKLSIGLEVSLMCVTFILFFFIAEHRSFAYRVYRVYRIYHTLR